MARKQRKIEYITNFDLCDRAHFDIVKGISIVLWLACLICVNYLNMKWLAPFSGISVALCLLCSGYGVSQSFIRKGGLIHYWENKIIKVWIPSLVCVVVFSYLIYDDLIFWVGSNPLAFSGWQLYIVFAEYLAFWVIYTYIENDNARLICLFLASAIGFAVVQEQSFSQQLFCFPVGVLFSQLGLRSKTRRLSVSTRILLCGVLLILAAAGFALRNYLTGYAGAAVGAVFCISAAALIILGSYFIRKIQVFGIFVPAGNIAYGVYLLAPNMLYLLRRWMVGYDMLAVVLGVVIVASVFSWLRELLIMYNKKIRRSKNSRLKGMM